MTPLLDLSAVASNMDWQTEGLPLSSEWIAAAVRKGGWFRGRRR